MFCFLPTLGGLNVFELQLFYSENQMAHFFSFYPFSERPKECI